MRFALLTKRRYTNKDLIADCFGRLFHLPTQLSALGHEGIVVAADLHTGKEETVCKQDVTFFSLPLTLGKFRRFLKTSRDVLETFQPDVLIASGDSYLGYLGARIARQLQIPFAFDVYDDYSVFSSNKIPGMKRLFYNAVRNADLVVTSSAPLRQRLSPLNSNVIEIANGFDPKVFQPLPKSRVRAKLAIPETDIVIGYFGSISEDLGINVLLKAAESLLPQVHSLRVLLAGHKASNVSLDGTIIDYRGFLPQSEIPVLINACDVVVVPYLGTKQVQQSNACKIAEYIACGVPVVVTKVSSHADIFKEAEQSLCEPNNPEHMASAIHKQLHSPQILMAPKELTWERLAGELAEALECLLREPRKASC